MGLITGILKIALQVLAGVGLGELADKILPDKVPTYPVGGLGLGFKSIPRLVWIVIIFAGAIMALKFIGRKTRIQILK